MSETLGYIEDYFEEKLSSAEKQIFEDRCIQDESFAGEVAFYITSREAVRQKLLEQKREQWSVDEQGINTSTPTAAAPVKKLGFRKWLPYAAAACLLLAMTVYFLYPAKTPRQLAADYVKSLTHIGQNMGTADSLQQGIEDYNNGNYNKALALFEGVYQVQPENSDAKEYMGRVYLMTKDYDKALVHFDELSQKKDLVSNPGVFLKAVTLLERNKRGDKEAAKLLLEQVVGNKRLEHKKEAAEWLKKW